VNDIELRADRLRKEGLMGRFNVCAITVPVAMVLLAAPGGAAGPPAGALKKCPADSIVSGAGCMDKYEASVWRVPNPTTANAALVRRIQAGKATEAALTAGGATQLGTASADYGPCTARGEHCTDDVYAVSLPSVRPSAFVTWFQAEEACANAGKRLPTNAEWQVAANGTPDPGPDDGTTDCNVGDGTEFEEGSPTLTGARSRCVSARGAFDMVGNLLEWVADWVPASSSSPGWGGFSNDLMSLSGASTSQPFPGALVRGGAFFFGPSAGPLMVGDAAPNLLAERFVGFRCAR
jgi:formylglycine-generating enzyme required for sulfatase activity